jgi:hypothetical protein
MAESFVTGGKPRKASALSPGSGRMPFPWFAKRSEQAIGTGKRGEDGRPQPLITSTSAQCPRNLLIPPIPLFSFAIDYSPRTTDSFFRYNSINARHSSATMRPVFLMRER